MMPSSLGVVSNNGTHEYVCDVLMSAPTFVIKSKMGDKPVSLMAVYDWICRRQDANESSGRGTFTDQDDLAFAEYLSSLTGLPKGVLAGPTGVQIHNMVISHAESYLKVLAEQKKTQGSTASSQGFTQEFPQTFDHGTALPSEHGLPM